MEYKNKFYLGLNNTDKEEKFKVLFENLTNTSRQFNDKIDTVSNAINFNEILSEFIGEQKDNSLIDLSFIYFKDEIKETFFDRITNKEILFANTVFQKKAV